MLKQALRYLLKVKGKSYLIPFLDNISHIGQPSSVMFPTELIEQGAGLVLSGINNTLTFHSNMDWVWPYWFERQIDPDANEFIPSGVNVLTVNLSQRNWTSIGIEDSRIESMLDPVGMLNLFRFGYSIFPYVRIHGKDYFPPRLSSEVAQSLEQGTLPSVMTKYDITPELGWHSTCTGIHLDKEQLVYYPQYFKNNSDTPIRFTAGISIRPYNCLTIGHINKLAIKNNLWRVNGKPGLLLLKEPDRVHVSDRHSGDPLTTNLDNATTTQKFSRTGILSGISEYDITLAPRESTELPFVATIAQTSKAQFTKFKNISKENVKKEYENTLKHWNHHQYNGMEISIPNKRLQKFFYALKNRIHIFDDGDHFSPGTFFYHEHWFRDSTFIAQCFDNLGYHQTVTPKIKHYFSKQQKNGFFKSHDGEWDSNGQALWTIINHFKYIGKYGYLDRYFDKLIKSIQWLDKSRLKNAPEVSYHRGLLPAGFSAEHFGPNDHYFWDNFWNLAGLKEVLWLSKKLNKSESEWLEDHYLSYGSDIETAIDRTLNQQDHLALPSSPYRRIDSGAVGNLITQTPLSLFEDTPQWYKPTIDYLWDNNIHNGLFFQKIFHTGLNPYLSIQLAKSMLICHDTRYLEIIEGVMNYATPTFTWPEAINPKTRGGCMGDGDHGWVCAEFLTLIRELFIFEAHDRVILCKGLEIKELENYQKYSIHKAPTQHGLFDFEVFIDRDNHLHIKWNRELVNAQESKPIVFELPIELLPYFHNCETETINGSRFEFKTKDNQGEINFAYTNSKQYQ